MATPATARRLLSVAALGCALGGAAPAFAAQSGTAAPGNIDYINGGITVDEADAMRAQAPRFPLELMFAEHRGDEGNAFVADADIRIYDAAGREVAALNGQGPIFLADLPDGRYTVEAEHDGRVQRQQVTVRNGQHRKLGFLW